MGGEPIPVQPRTPRWTVAAAVVAVGATVAMVHWPALSSAAFSFDDGEYLIGNRLVQNPSWESAWRFLSEVRAPSTVRGYYQPLNMISIMLDYALGGRDDNLRPFHRTSLILHVVNMALIVVLLYRLFGDPLAAAAGALLLGVHPLTVEPVPWVGERKTLLAALFALTSLLAYVRYAQRRSIPGYAVSVVAYALALLAKPTSTPIPLLMLLLDYWPLGRIGDRKSLARAVVEKLPLFAIGAASAVVTFLSQRATHTAQAPGEYPWTHIPLRFCHNLGFYLHKIVWPTDLSIVYTVPEPFGIAHPAVIKGIVITIGVMLACALLWRRWRVPGIGLIFFILAILPVMGIVRFTAAVGADKYTYLPMLGLSLIVAWGVTQLRRNLPNRLIVIAALILLICAAESIATRRQYQHWRSTRALFAQAVRFAPGEDLVHTGLAEGLRAEGRYSEALASAREAVRLQPMRAENWKVMGLIQLQTGGAADAINSFETALKLEPSAWSRQNLAMALAAVGRYEDAIRLYESALKDDPSSPVARNNYALSLLAVGRLDEAHAILTRLTAERPEYARGRISLARVLKARGDAAGARTELEQAVRTSPQSVEAHAALAGEYAGAGRMDEALVQARLAVNLRPHSSELLNSLAVLCASTGRLDEAGELFGRVIELNSDAAEAYHNRALTLRDRGRFDEAARDWENALRLKPDYADALYAFGKMLLQQGRHAAAAARFEALLKLEPDNDEVMALLDEARGR